MNPLLQEFGHQIVDKYYRYDPETEDLIYSDELKEGMIVLPDMGERTYTNNVYGAELYVSTRFVMNRWCEVTKLRTEEIGGVTNITFVGLYVQDYKHIHGCNKNRGWLVKRASIPVEKVGGENEIDTTSVMVDPHMPDTSQPQNRVMVQNNREKLYLDDWKAGSVQNIPLA